MDEIKEKIEAVVEKLKSDPSLMKKFNTEPVKVVETLIGIDLPDDIINKVIDGVKAKIAAGELSDTVDNVKDALGGLFSKFKK